MTTPTEPSVLKAEAAALWEQDIAGHPDEDNLRRRDVVGNLLSPAIDAWLAASPGREQILAATRVGWDYGYSRNVPRGVALAAGAVRDGLSQIREQRDPQMRDVVFRRAARDVGLDPDDHEDLRLHALFDSLAFAGVISYGNTNGRELDDLATVIDIAADVLTGDMSAPAISSLARYDPGFPHQLGDDVVDVVRDDPREVQRVIAAASVGWRAGLATAEDVGTVYAVHHIAMLAEQEPDLRMGARTPAEWAHDLAASASDRLHQRLGDTAARQAIATAESEARRPGTATPVQDTADHSGVGRAGAAFPKLTSVQPQTTATAAAPFSTEANARSSQQHRSR